LGRKARRKGGVAKAFLVEFDQEAEANRLWERKEAELARKSENMEAARYVVVLSAVLLDLLLMLLPPLLLAVSLRCMHVINLLLLTHACRFWLSRAVRGLCVCTAFVDIDDGLAVAADCAADAPSSQRSTASEALPRNRSSETRSRTKWRSWRRSTRRRRCPTSLSSPSRSSWTAVLVTTRG
jgi:hypothetical protein